MGHVGKTVTQNVVSGSEITDGTVDTADLADDAVTQDKIGADAVGTTELANDIAISTSGAITTTGAFTSTGIDDNANSTAMTIDSSERVLIGTTNNAFGTTDADDLVVGNSTGNHGITIASNSSNGYSSILFSDADSGNGRLAGYIDYGHSANEMTFGGGGVGNTIMKLLSNKDVKIQDGNLVIGTSGHGIDFSAVSHASGMTSELLDSYETGTWTATITTGSGSVNLRSDRDLCSYTKIGNMVTVRGRIDVNDVSSPSGHALISNLPFTSSNSFAELSVRSGGAMMHDSFTGLATGASVIYQTHPNTTSVNIYEQDQNGSAELGGHIQAGSLLVFDFQYPV